MKFLNFFYFCGSFLPSRIRIHWPDWIRIQSGSETETLQVSSTNDQGLCVGADVCAQEPAGPAQRAGASRPRGPGLSGWGRRFCSGQFRQPSRFARKNQLVQHSEQVHPGHAGQVCLVEDVDSAQVSFASLPWRGIIAFCTRNKGLIWRDLTKVISILNWRSLDWHVSAGNRTQGGMHALLQRAILTAS